MLRRILPSFFLLCAFWGALTPVAPAAEVFSSPSIRVEEVEAVQGESVVLRIFYESTEPLAAVSFLLFFDGTILTLTNVELSVPLDDNQVQTNTSERGVFAFTMAHIDGLSGSGTLVSLTFRIDPQAALKTTMLSLAVLDAYDLQLSDVEVESIDGSIRIVAPTPSVKNISFAMDTVHPFVKIDQVFEIKIRSDQLKNLAAGTFDIVYDPALFEFLELKLGTAWDLPDSLHVVSSLKGFVTLSYASIDGLDQADPCFTLSFKTLSPAYARTEMALMSRNLVDIDLQPMEAPIASIDLYVTEIAPPNPILAIRPYEGPNDEPFEVEVAFGPNTGIAAGDFTIQYSTGFLRAIEVVDLSPGTTQTGYVVVHPDIANGTIRFSYLNETGLTGEQIILRIRFEPIGVTGTRILPLYLSGTGVVDTAFQGVGMDYQTGFATLRPYYTITYLQDDDTILSQMHVPEQTALTPPDVPQRFGQTFVGWSETLTTATKDATIRAIYRDDHVTFVASKNVVYNGQIQELTVMNLPSGAVATFSPNEFEKDVGTYAYEIRIEKEGYETLVLQATLTIQKASIRIIAENRESLHGENLTDLIYRIEGSTFGDVIDVTLHTDAIPVMGTYSITASAEHPNYDITLVPGIYRVRGKDIDVSNLVFSNVRTTYDGTEKTILMEGSLPEGVLAIEYANHRRTHAGTSLAVAMFVVDVGYEKPANRIAELTIDPALITTVTFVDASFVYDGAPHTIAVNTLLSQYGDLLEVAYQGQTAPVDAGTYAIRAILTHPDYVTLELTAILNIAKRATTITVDMVEIDVFATRAVLSTAWTTRTILSSIDGLTFTAGPTISSLSPLTDYELTVYLEETANELASNLIVLTFQTTQDPQALLSLIPSLLSVNLATPGALREIASQIELLHDDDKAVVQSAHDAWADAYNAWIDSLQAEYEATLPLTRRIVPWTNPPGSLFRRIWIQRREEEC